LEEELGIPVVTSTQACLRRVKRRSDPKFGRLFGFK
jgi:maleate cis-trans isomerase